MTGALSKKRKRDVAAQRQPEETVDTSKPTAVFKPTKGRKHTLSVALPGSIIANCQTHDQKTSLAAHLARALAVFSVDEIVIFNDGQSHTARRPSHPSGRDFAAEDAASGYTGFSDPDDFLNHVLSYLETPPHLRRLLFPMHPNLRTAGAMPSLDMPHHMKANEWCRYREGVVAGPDRSGTASLVECGLPVKARIPDDVEINARATVRFESESEPAMLDHTPLNAEAVGPDVPREEAGYYWGYACRRAESLSAVFTESLFEGGYDVSIGTSERGVDLAELGDGVDNDGNFPVAPIPRDWQHMVLVFGGVAGLEVALKADKELTSKGVEDVKDLFDYWVNLVPGQGSRTIRTEEAVWLGLMGLRKIVTKRERS